MLPLFSFKIKINSTRQREIKILLLKTNNKRNTTIDNSVKKVMGISIRSWIAAIFSSSHASLESLKTTCIRSWMGRYIKPWTAKRDMRKANQVLIFWIIRNKLTGLGSLDFPTKKFHRSWIAKSGL